MQAAYAFGSVIGGVIMSTGFIAMGLLATWVALSSFKTAWAMQSWPSVQGEIRSARIQITANGLYKPQIEYGFTVGERQIVGKRRTLFERSTINRVWADTVVAQHPVGSSVTVYYDPSDPRQCVVDRDNARTLGAILPFVGLAFSGVGVVLLSYFTR